MKSLDTPPRTHTILEIARTSLYAVIVGSYKPFNSTILRPEGTSMHVGWGKLQRFVSQQDRLLWNHP